VVLLSIPVGHEEISDKSRRMPPDSHGRKEPKMTEARQELQEMQARLVQLEDIHNSQAALNEKIAKVQMDLLEKPDATLA